MMRTAKVNSEQPKETSGTDEPVLPASEEELEFPDSITKGFQRLPSFDKQWVIAHSLASLSNFTFLVAALGCYLTRDHRDCDGRNPFSDAAIYSFPLWLFGIAIWIYSDEFRQYGKKLGGPNPLGLEERRRRRVRTPWLFVACACLQCVAALNYGLIAHRTSRENLGFGAVPVAGSIAVSMSLVAGIYNICMAASSYQRRQDADVGKVISLTSSVVVSFRLETDEELETVSGQMHTQRLNKSTRNESGEVKFLFDTTLDDFNSLPAFNRQWITLRVLAFVSRLPLLSISSVLSWTAACGSVERQFLTGMLKYSLEPIPSLLICTAFALPDLSFLAGGASPFARVRHWLMPIVPFYSVLLCWVMLYLLYENTPNTYGLLLVHVQGYIAIITTLLSAIYDIALIYKTNLGAEVRRRRRETKALKLDEKKQSVGTGGSVKA